MGHDHGDEVGERGTHHHDHGVALADLTRLRQRRVLWWVLVANAAALVAEVVGGLVFGSVALLADAAHLLTDVAGLGVALIAHGLLDRPHSARHTFGLQRAEVLGAAVNGVLLLITGVVVSLEALRRLGIDQHIDGGPVMAIAAVGLLVNLGSAVALARAAGRSLNMRGAYLHMLADAAGSVGAVVAGAAVLAAGATWVDPVVGLLIGLGVLWAAWRLMRGTTHVLLEGAPMELDTTEVHAAIAGVAGVDGVHHLHLWSLASDTPALSAHVVVEADDLPLHDAQALGGQVRAVLARRFGIGHATLELECHACDGGAVGGGQHQPAGTEA